MMASLTPRQQSAVSYSALAIALAFVLSAVLAAPLRERVSFFSSLDTQRTTYAKSMAALARSDAVGAELERRRTASDPTDDLFHAATAALAGAELQNQLNSLITAQGGQVLSAAFRDAPGTDPLTRYVLRGGATEAADDAVAALAAALYSGSAQAAAATQRNRPRWATGAGRVEAAWAVW